MAGAAGRNDNNGNTALRADGNLFDVVTRRTYLLMAVTGLGYLSLMWSTVVLLGGFVTVLTNKDFSCLTVISMIQAARIFNDLAEHVVPNLVIMLTGNFATLVPIATNEIRYVAGAIRRMPAARSSWYSALTLLYQGGIVVPFQAVVCVTIFLYWYSAPFACIALALWRIAKRDYYSRDNGSGGGNLTPALDMFYSLILLQGGLYVVWALWPQLDFPDASLLRGYRRQLGLPDKEWCNHSLRSYLEDTRRRCWREPTSIRGRKLCDFAIDSLESGSWEDVLSGVRLLAAFVMQGGDIRPLLLPSRPRIQKLIDALGWRLLPDQDGRAREMRELAARIVAHMAGDIHLAQYPGAMECISSLLQEEAATSLRDWRPNQLILQGLVILARLAFDHHNCIRICSTPGLLHKIMAPLSSVNLIHDCIRNRNWASLVNGSFRVLYNLMMQAPGETGSKLRLEIYINNQLISNLNSIIHYHHWNEAAGCLEEQLLQIGATAILAELTLDLSINIAKETKENLIMKVSKIFLADGEEGEEPAATSNLRLKHCAGVTLLLLSTEIESNSGTIMTAHDNIISHLTGMLDANNAPANRTIAAQILENLCAHCEDKKWAIETLLPKVIRGIVSTERATPRDNVRSPHNDEESQQNSAQENEEESHNGPSQQNDTNIQETCLTADQDKKSGGRNDGQTAGPKFMQESFLSLAVAIRDKLISADDFEVAIQLTGLEPGAFVAKMKTIVQENCQEADQSLRIVKLCDRIVEPMMQRVQYAQHFRNTEFEKSLSEASKIMSNLESCVLFAGTDFGLKKTLRPLISDLMNIISSAETFSDLGMVTGPEIR